MAHEKRYHEVDNGERVDLPACLQLFLSKIIWIRQLTHILQQRSMQIEDGWRVGGVVAALLLYSLRGWRKAWPVMLRVCIWCVNPQV